MALSSLSTSRGEHPLYSDLPYLAIIDSGFFQSLAYACITNSEAPAVAVTCTLQVAAQRADGSTVVQELAYNPREARNAMNSTTFPASFSNLESLTIQVLSSSAPVDTVAPLVDNNHYLAFIRS